MELRLQCKTATLLEMLRERLVAHPMTVKSHMAGNTLVVLDRFDVGTPTLGDGSPRTRAVPIATGGVHVITSPALRASVPVTVFFHIINDAQSSSAVVAGMAQEQRRDITFHLHLDYERAASGRDVLSVTYAGFESSSPLPSFLPHAVVDNVLREALQFPSIELDVPGHMAGTGIPRLDLVWVGIAPSPDFSFIEMRLEVQFPPQSGSTDIARWVAFYDRQLESLGSEDWALSVDQVLILGLVRLTLETEMAKAAAEFRREGSVGAIWRPELPGVEMSVSGEVIDACVGIDLDVDVKAVGRLSLEGDRLRADTQLAVQFLDAFEFGVCKLALSVLSPLVGLGLVGGPGTNEWFGFSAVLVGNLPHLLMSGLASAEPAAPQSDSPDPCTMGPSGPTHWICTVPLPLNPPKRKCEPPHGKRTATALRGISSGLVLAGEFSAAQLMAPTVGVSATPFRWTMGRLKCSGPPNPLVAEAHITVERTSGNSDFALAEARAVGSFAHVFGPHVSIDVDTCPTRATIRIAVPMSEYVSVKCQILVVTSHGAFLAELAGIPLLSEEEVESMQRAAALERVNRCYAKSRRWDIRWLIDPPYALVDGSFEQLWHVAAEHALPHMGLRAETERGETVARAFANPRGTVQLGLVAATATLGLVWETERGEIAEGDLKPIEMSAQQVLLLEQDQLTLAEPALAIGLRRDGDAVTINIVHSSGLEVHTVNTQGRIALRRWIRTPPLAGAVPVGPVFATWSDAGEALLLDPSDSAPRAWRGDAEANGTGGWATTLARVPGIRSARWLPRMQRMVIQTGNGLSLHDGESRRLLAAREHSDERLVEMDGKGDRIATSNSGVTRVWEVDRFGSRIPLAEHYARPWFVGAARTRGWLARLDDSRQRVSLLRVVRTHRL